MSSIDGLGVLAISNPVFFKDELFGVQLVLFVTLWSEFDEKFILKKGSFCVFNFVKYLENLSWVEFIAPQ